jgi:Mor family transcriptional regulator
LALIIQEQHLANEEVMSIYNSTETNATLAVEYKTSETCIAKIKTGRTWGHLTGKRFSKSFTPLSAEAIQDIISSTLTRAALAKKYNVSWAAINKTIKRMRR